MKQFMIITILLAAFLLSATACTATSKSKEEQNTQDTNSNTMNQEQSDGTKDSDLNNEYKLQQKEPMGLS